MKSRILVPRRRRSKMEASQPRGLNPQLFELLKVLFTLLVTGFIGGAITSYYQDRSWQKQQEAKDLETARESAVTFLREFADILERRKYAAYRCLSAFKHNLPHDETDQLWKSYMEAVSAWNIKWNLYRALILNELGLDLQKRFYDPVVDEIGDFRKCSITGKLIILHTRMLAAHKQLDTATPRIDTAEIDPLYESLADDCYAFYSDVISHIQAGRVVKRAWMTENAK